MRRPCSFPNLSPTLYRTDGTTVQPVFSGNPLDLTAVNGKLFFVSRLQGTQGTTVGLFEVSSSVATPIDIYNFGSAGNLTNVNGELYFATNVNDSLWKSDGTVAGTVRVASFSTGSFGPNLLGFTDVNGTLYFSANTGHGYRLWKSDGTEAGTVRVAGPDGTGPLDPFNLLNVNGELFFSASDATFMRGLYTSDGTADGTQRIANINIPIITTVPSAPSVMVNVNGTVYFPADDGTHGVEL